MSIGYSTELTIEQYQLLESLLPSAAETGRPRTVDMRLVIQGILYVLASGCAWRLMPKEYPPSSTVYYYFAKWRDDGSWQQIHDRLVEWVRIIQGRESSPSAGSMDSQTVPSAVMVNQDVGYDGGKKLKGRKRFTLVDPLGLLIGVKVVAANVHERDGAKQLRSQVHTQRHRFPRLVRIWAARFGGKLPPKSCLVDAGFSGVEFLQSIMDLFGLILDVVLRPQERQGFVLLPRRWVVERTYGWFHWCRRLNVDYERLPASSESLIYIAMIRLMLLRLA